MMKDILTLIWCGYALFLCFMGTPFGIYWNLDLLDSGKPAYGFLIVLYGTVPMLFLGAWLGLY